MEKLRQGSFAIAQSYHELPWMGERKGKKETWSLWLKVVL